PTRHLQALTSLSPQGVTYNEESDTTFLVAASAALCLVGGERSQAIGFRRGEFARHTKARELSLATLRGPLTAAAAILICFFASVLVQSKVYEARLQDTNTALERSVKSFFGQLSNSAVKTYLSNTTALKSSINKELAKNRELARLTGPNP